MGPIFLCTRAYAILLIRNFYRMKMPVSPKFLQEWDPFLIDFDKEGTSISTVIYGVAYQSKAMRESHGKL